MEGWQMPLRKGEHPTDVLARVVDGTMQMAERHKLGWAREKEIRAVRKRILSGYNNVLLKDYDPATGVIPDWLPGEFHAAWIERLKAGRLPNMGLNPGGFYVRSYQEKQGGEKEESAKEAPRDQTDTNSPPGKKHRFKLVSFHDLRPGPEPLYLVDELIPVAGLVDVWGKAKCYKSFWCLDLMLHVAMGWEYRDRYVRPGAVVYCAFEGAHGYKKRIEALRRHYKITDDTPVPLHVMPGQANLIAEHTVLISDITAQLGEVRPAAVVLDTLNKSLFGSENKDVDMGAYVRAAEAIRDAFGCVVIIIHHCGYDDTRPRGHSSLPGAVDAQLAVIRTEEVITVTVEMMRDGPEDIQVVSEVEVIPVGQDQNGKELTSLVVIPSDADAANRERQDWSRGLNIFHAALRHALANHGEAFQPEAGVLPVRAVGLWAVRDRFYATYAETEENDTKRQERLRKAFNRALADAQKNNIIRVKHETGQLMLWLPVRGEA
jgi:AAA domain